MSKITLVGLDSNKNEIGNVSIKNFKIQNYTGGYNTISANSIWLFKDNGYHVSSVYGTPIPSGQNFYVEFDAPTNKNMMYVKLKIEFKYMLCEGKYNRLSGTMLQEGYYQKSQSLGIADAKRTIYTKYLELEPVELKLPSLGGNVWLDGLVAQGKENNEDGKNKTANDISLPNIKVTLYTSDGRIATLDADPKESGLSNEDIMHRVNPTYTDKNGDYVFEGIDASKQYYVVFEYDGQLYLPTTKLTESTNTSKGLEKANERTQFNNKFAEIRSYPENYKTTNSLGRNLGTYNKVYSQYDLMGYTLDENGKYRKTGIQLIDGFEYDENGNQTKNYTQGQISTKILQYIYSNKQSPDIKTIYSSIAGNNTESWRMLQFIEDCKIKSYTGNYMASSTYKDYINQGLWRRQESKIILTKDVLYGATRINGKTELYQYDNREEASNEWEIQTRMQNYAQYYAGAYVNGIYQSDYKYEGEATNGGNDLEVYITYRISVKNTSNSILMQIPEVVDYYDKNYEFMSDLSWVMYDKVNLRQDDYYNMIDTLSLSKIPNNKNINSSTSSQYGSTTHQDVANNMNAIYIKGIQNKVLGVGEQAYIYLTFKVKENSDGIILSDYTNYAEINSYKTFYANGTRLPNTGKITNNTTVAGIIDQKSVPGNLTNADLNGTKYEKNFENDTDRAVGISIELTGKERNLNGYVWEDSRNTTVNNAVIGDGIRNDGEKKVAGVTVQLIEKLSNGKEYLWKTVQTNKDGYYQFDGIIPGEYVIRFVYGGNKETIVSTYNNGVSYNGQDYKSTVYQKDMLDNKDLEKEYYDISGLDSYGKNLSDARDLWEDEKVTIKQDDTKQEYNVTLEGRTTVNNRSTTLTNEISELLALPYTKNSISEEEFKKLQPYTQMVAETAIINLEGERNAKITIGKSSNVGNSNPTSPNGNYVLANIDFGLTERPKSQIELNKTVEHIKVVLANQNVLFDSKEATNNLIWQEATKYNLNSYMKNNKYEFLYKDNILQKIGRDNGENNGIIQITMDEEIMHGATIQISYNVGIKNSSETDYTGEDFYYKGIVTNESKLVTTTAIQLLDYISNNLQYRLEGNTGWTAVKASELIEKGIVNKNLQESIEQFNVILQTSDFATTPLEPGQEAIKQNAITLTQVITPENENDDLTYENVAEIVQTTNTVGRRLAFSIVGNQNPTEKAQEVDTGNSEQVVILPPFGAGYLYIGLGVVVAVILAGGIVLIKKKVLKNKK